MRTRVAIVITACSLLLSAWGCGFAPQEEFSGRRAGDGIAPWSDLGPVQICLGVEYLGPPSSQPGGMCNRTTVVPSPCVSDSDCNSRESCVCGSCTVQYCTVNSDCGGGRLCFFGENRCNVVCAADDECPDGECISGSCRGRCFTDDDCQTGEVCNADNNCITDPCNADGDCLAGERCRIQRVPRVATEPHVLARSQAGEARFTMWLELSDPIQQDRRAIWRAVSDDGIHYSVDPARPVLDDNMQARAPSIVRTPTGYGLYYQLGDGTAIKYAASSDGTSFSGESEVLSGAGSVTAPSAVLLPSGDVVVYYLSGNGTAISVARGSIGGSLSTQGTVLDQGDIEDPGSGEDSQFWVGVQTLASPHALATTSAQGEPSLRIWFSAFATESGDSFQFGETIPIAPTYSLGYAAADVSTPEVAQVWPFNPIFDRVDAFIEHLHELAPAAVQISTDDGTPLDGYLLYYTDGIDSVGAGVPADVAPNRIGVAGNGTFRSVTGDTK